MKYTQSCCCFSVRTGCLIFGVLGILGAVYSIFQESYSLANKDIYMNDLEKQVEELRTQYENGQITEENFEMAKTFYAWAISAITGLMVFGVIIAVFNLLRCILLIVGVNYEKPLLMLPYIIVDAINVVILAAIWIIGTLGMFVAVGFLSGFLYFILLGPIVLLLAYFLWVVISHYKELDEKVNSASAGYVYNEMATKK